MKKKVLISGLLFKNFTGSEMYMYELAINLIKLNYDVSILSPNLGNPLKKMATSKGIKVYNFENPPIKQKFDIIHAQHQPIVQALNELFPNVPKVCSIHSEIIDLENPVKHKSIKKYIAIRPSIKDYIINNFNINEGDIDIIYNPIDKTKFNTESTEDKDYILFVGTIDNIRRNAINDLCNYAASVNKEFWLIGSNNSNYLEYLTSRPHVKYYEATNEINKFVKGCHQTGGIMLGRTTIEGWMCGKPGWIYTVDKYGNIQNKELHEPIEDLNKFEADFVANKISEIYKEILK